MPRYRAHDVIREDRTDGSILLRCPAPLENTVDRTTDWLERWSSETPDAVFLAERSGAGWREVTYAEARQMARSLAAGLLSHGLGPEKPILILSGNSVNHGILALAAQYVGVPIVPLAEQYALIPGAQRHIDFAARLVRPGAVFVEDAKSLSALLARDVFEDCLTLSSRGGQHNLDDLMKTGGDIAAAHAQVTPDTVAKILMTSGSTSDPKGVPTTQRMMCVNQAQIAHALPFLNSKPPVIVDWLPWNHVFGGSHNFNMMLANGGALYIDAGKPVPHLIGTTIENLGLKTGSMAFNVPAGFAMIRDELRRDRSLRQRFFENLDMLFYAGASLPQQVWSDLEEMAREVRGDMPLFTSSWGLTETAPAHLLQHQPTKKSGVIGVPMPGQVVKLIPDADMRCEVRVKGPNVFEGYLDSPEMTAQAFDEEGFFRTGDAMRFVDPDDPNMGLRFDGRLSEEFKLSTGTWVRAAGLRLRVLAALEGIAADVVVTGQDRSDIGVLIVPTQALREQCQASAGSDVLAPADMGPEIARRLSEIGGSSSTRVARALVLEEAPSMPEGEVTAKGNLNAQKILSRRRALVDRLHDDQDPATILVHGEPR